MGDECLWKFECRYILSSVKPNEAYVDGGVCVGGGGGRGVL